jgi:hypothetical protein
VGDAVQAVRDAVPTSRHARLLFSMVEDLLGDSGYVESTKGGVERRLYARDGQDYVPWPVLSLNTEGRIGHVVMIRGPEEPPAPQGRERRLRNLSAGEIIVHDSAESVTVTYGEDGRWFETASTDEPLLWVEEGLAAERGGPTERFAAYVAGLRRKPPTLRMPVPLPGALQGAWVTGRRGIRHALFHGRVPDDAAWVAADGYDGIALGWGATREEALEHWRGEVERLQPRPPAPREPSGPPPPGGFTVRTARADGETPEPAPGNTPAAVVELRPLPSFKSPCGAWTRLLGDYGECIPALLHQDVAGFTLVGYALAAVLATVPGGGGLADLEGILDEIPALSPDARVAPHRDYNCVLTIYEILERGTHELAPRACESMRSDGFDPGVLDPRRLLWQVVRQRWRDLE